MICYIDGYETAPGYGWRGKQLIRRITGCICRYRQDADLLAFYRNALGAAQNRQAGRLKEK